MEPQLAEADDFASWTNRCRRTFHGQPFEGNEPVECDRGLFIPRPFPFANLLNRAGCRRERVVRV